MAQIDLSRFNPGIRQDNRQRQVFSENGASIYESISKVSRGVADIAMDVIATNRKREHEDFQTKSFNSMQEKEMKFDTEWTIRAGKGEITDQDGRSYLEAKNQFFTDTIKEIEDTAPDKALFSAYKNNLDSYKSKRTVKAIEDNYELGVKAVDYKFNTLIDDWEKKFSVMDYSAYKEAYNTFFMASLDNVTNETTSLSKSKAEDKRKEALTKMSKIIKDKVVSVDFQVNPVTKVVEDIVPLDIYFTEAGRYNIDFIKEAKVSGSPEEIEYALQNVLELDKYMVSLAKKNLEAKYSRG
jgi:hypothetical protein